ncbi:hypothetical protein Tco_0355753 [Tanacetum coccineum]
MSLMNLKVYQLELILRPGPHISRKSHLLEDKEISSVGVFDEVKHWKGIYVTWAKLKKKQDKDATLQDFDGTLRFTVHGDGVVIPSDTVKA